MATLQERATRARALTSCPHLRALVQVGQVEVADVVADDDVWVRLQHQVLPAPGVGGGKGQGGQGQWKSAAAAGMSLLCEYSMCYG
jgi:hypothetical protein